MAFFRKKRKGIINAKVKVADVYVVTSTIISNYTYETDVGPMYVKMYFLAKCEDGEYYELFSGKKLKKYKNPENGSSLRSFDTPYVEKAEPLSQYLTNYKKVRIDVQSLFDFITQMNVLDKLGALSDKEDEETSQEF